MMPVPMQALALAHSDAAQGKLAHEKQLKMRDTIEEIVAELRGGDRGRRRGRRGRSEEAAHAQGAWSGNRAVLCLASRSPLDEAACLLLQQLLEKHGIGARVQPFADIASLRAFKLDAQEAPLVCLSYFGAVGNPAHVRYLIRRLRRVMPGIALSGGVLDAGGAPAEGGGMAAAVAPQLVATSLAQAVAIAIAEAGGHAASAASPGARETSARAVA
jgi:hypothetical protein